MVRWLRHLFARIATRNQCSCDLCLHLRAHGWPELDHSKPPAIVTINDDGIDLIGFVEDEECGTMLH